MPHRLKNRVRHKFHNAVTSSGVHENKILPFSIFPPSLSPFPHDLNQRSPLLRSSTAPATTTLPSPPPASSLNGVAARGRSAPQSSLPAPITNVAPFLPLPLRPPPWLPWIHAMVVVEEPLIARATSSPQIEPMTAWARGGSSGVSAPTPLPSSGTY